MASATELTYTLNLTSPLPLEITSEEVIFISFLATQLGSQTCSPSFNLSCPVDWTVIGQPERLHLEPLTPALYIVGIKAPNSTLAGTYTLTLEIDQQPYLILPLTVKSQIALTSSIAELPSSYLADTPSSFKLICHNESNIPLTVKLEVATEPNCPIHFYREPFVLPPLSSQQCSVELKPQTSPESPKQFVFIKIQNIESNATLSQQVVTLDGSPTDLKKDDFIHFPSSLGVFISGDNGDKVAGIKYEGEGCIDPERERFLEFFFCLPNRDRTLYYEQDQRFYIGLWDPHWSLDLGDTVYHLSPLTQDSRYGRGAGIDYQTEKLAWGLHYTRNTFKTDYNPKETGTYVRFFPSEECSFGLNFLHKSLRFFPKANILTFESHLKILEEHELDIELGKNFYPPSLYKRKSHCFIKNNKTLAYRMRVQGTLNKIIDYTIESLHAGADFFGYYSHQKLFSCSVYFPLQARLHATLSYTRLKQNFDAYFYGSNQSIHSHPAHYFKYKARYERDQLLAPDQKQWNTTLSYQLDAQTSIALNSLTLKAKDTAMTHHYDFLQHWLGTSYNYSNSYFYLNSTYSIGQQQDYLTHLTSHFLQKYTAYCGTHFTPHFSTSLFLEYGNTNYYDAKPKRNSYGMAFNYRYKVGCLTNLFLQRVSHPADHYVFSQISYYLHHLFSTRHFLDFSIQYFRYKKHDPKEFLFLLSYTIPFDTIIGRKNDSSTLSGYLYDPSAETLMEKGSLSQATLSCNGQQALTDPQGGFNFNSLSVGKQELRIAILPENYVPLDSYDHIIDIKPGKNAFIYLPIVPACQVIGSILPIIQEQDNCRKEIEEQDELQKINLNKITVHLIKEDGSEELTCQTNAQGQFYFNHLRPGDWLIHLDDHSLSTSQHFSMNDLIFTLQPTEKKNITFNICSKIRSIQLISH